MSYFPLDRDLLTSSTWAQGSPEAVKVWIYLLLVACPRDGTVDDADPAIALHCGLPLAATSAALDWLGAPDPYSRARDHEGRRLERLPGGGLRLLNYVTRRDKDHSTARVQRWREQQGDASKKTPAYPRVGANCPCCLRRFATPFNRFVVLDHNHETGATRDYICQGCNKRVGIVEQGGSIDSDHNQTIAGASDSQVRAYISSHETVSSLRNTVGNDEHEHEHRTERSEEEVASGPPDEPTKLGLSADQRTEYARAVWAALVERRGSERPEMTSAERDELARWMDARMPLRIVLAGIRECAGKPKHLLYCVPAVREALERFRKALPPVRT